MTMLTLTLAGTLFCSFLLLESRFSLALNGDQVRIQTFNGWKAFEVITAGDSTESEGWVMPEKFDGAGAFLVDSATIRINVNHEIKEKASISEITLNKDVVKRAIFSMIQNNNIGNNKFVTRARLAYDRFSEDGGESFDFDVDPIKTQFCALCSSQAYKPNTFGDNRGFVDQLYLTGEECPDGRLYVLDPLDRTLYKLSGFTGSSSSQNGGMPFDPWENAALVDTGETNHVALFLSSDGEYTNRFLRLYIGKKGKNQYGEDANDFLSRNGLAYGEWFYLIADFPATGGTNNGSFKKEDLGALKEGKMEDVDTNPNNPTQVVLAEQNRGLYIFDLDLDFSNGYFDFGSSSFSVTKIRIGSMINTDNVEWSENGKIFVNEDIERGGVWYTAPNGRSRTKIGETTVGAESSGIFDFSVFVDYSPGSVMITNSQGDPSSMTILINPDASMMENNFPATDILPGQNTPSTATTVGDIYEAEDATMVYSKIERRFSGFSGDGYVDMLGQGASLEWVVNAPNDGEYEISISYASSATRPLEFLVDGYETESFTFDASSGWTDWRLEGKIIFLSAGSHTMKVSAERSSGPNVDFLKVRYIQALSPATPETPPQTPETPETPKTPEAPEEPETPEAPETPETPETSETPETPETPDTPDEPETPGTPALPVTPITPDTPDIPNVPATPIRTQYEAEDGICGICEVTDQNDGFSGDGYVDFLGNNAYVQWTITIPTTDTYEVSIRYAARKDRPADFFVDGEKRKDIDFDSTGSWSSWATETFVVSLTEGSHVLKIDCGEKSIGPNVDWLSIEATGPARRAVETDDRSRQETQKGFRTSNLRGRSIGRNLKISQVK